MSAADEVNQVVDKLSEKASEALSTFTPLAEKVVREYQMMQVLGAIGYGLLGLIVIVAGILVMKKCFKRAALDDCDEPVAWFAGGITTVAITSLTGFITICFAISYAICAVSPTYHCLKELAK